MTSVKHLLSAPELCSPPSPTCSRVANFFTSTPSSSSSAVAAIFIFCPTSMNTDSASPSSATPLIRDAAATARALALDLVMILHICSDVGDEDTALQLAGGPCSAKRDSNS
ncbi:hypothetical protein VNO80_12866 [Phaseolus coccineus]|uniref:Uncharacterized protein n=1 Tax=Phaseolus coccineus TaxID=3886 RepID=A0AAN9R6L5_PHACN